MKYDALTLDAQTIEQQGFHFDAGLLAQLKQFANGPTEVIISVVCVSEVLKHLSERTRSAKDRLETAHKQAVEVGLKEHGTSAFAEGQPDARDIAKQRLETFINEIGAQLVHVDDVRMRDLFQMYFNAVPPFAATGKKKSEFPDAVALLSLEAWAKTQGKRILAVSADSDWLAFGAKSEIIDVIPSLADALASLQEHAEEATKIVQLLLEEMEAGKRDDMKKRFDENLGIEVANFGWNIYPEADSAFNAEGDDVELALNDYQIINNEGLYDFSIVQAGPNKIVARVEVELQVHAEASFALSVRDWIDKDFVNLGYSRAETDEQFEAAILITYEGDFATDEVEISSVELVEGPTTIYFGTVELENDDDGYGRD